MAKSITVYVVSMTGTDLDGCLPFDNEWDARMYNYDEYNGHGAYFTLEVPLDWTKAVATTNPYH